MLYLDFNMLGPVCIAINSSLVFLTILGNPMHQIPEVSTTSQIQVFCSRDVPYAESVEGTLLQNTDILYITLNSKKKSHFPQCFCTLRCIFHPLTNDQ